ncbi:hypothetical protein [Cesiribacter sp. SM1]|uniref:hypothetical protein n=1 Tax=Cesiribacter sp. SM1 TaxID=2861196 RepID=UPI001CD1C4C5|nr:hypothetical protein [Cesiribacter sp. SM1]
MLFTLSSCEKISEELDQADEVLEEFDIEGMYETFGDMIITIDEDGGKVTYFGTNDLGTNPSVFSIGGLYFKDLQKTGTNKYKAKIIQSDVRWSNAQLKNVLQSYTYTDTEITVEEDGLTLSEVNDWDIHFNKISGAGGSTGDNGGSTGGTGGTGSTNCSSTFDSYTNDAQLDAYCGYAWMYRCQQGKSLDDPAVKAVCTYYNDLKTSSAPDCPYCK